jgi:hypothetical protein
VAVAAQVFHSGLSRQRIAVVRVVAALVLLEPKAVVLRVQVAKAIAAVAEMEVLLTLTYRLAAVAVAQAVRAQVALVLAATVV